MLWVYIIVILLITITIVLVFSTCLFQKKVNAENKKMLLGINKAQKGIVTEEMMERLPGMVKKWMRVCGVVGSDIVKNVYLEQKAQMLFKPEQKSWKYARAKQYFTINPPAFNWSVDLSIHPLIKLTGRDKFENARGEMMIKLLSLLTIASIKNNTKINQASLQRYLAEIVWFPTAALCKYIEWEEINASSVKATMTYKGTTGSGIFYFHKDGSFNKFVAMRYKEKSDDKTTKWTVIALKNEIRNGLKIPTELQVSWELNNKDWTWLKVRITNIVYNI